MKCVKLPTCWVDIFPAPIRSSWNLVLHCILLYVPMNGYDVVHVTDTNFRELLAWEVIPASLSLIQNPECTVSKIFGLVETVSYLIRPPATQLVPV